MGRVAHLKRSAEGYADAAGVELVARFGAEIHVCGHDDVALERSVRRVKEANPHVEIARIDAGFEEIFIYLMSGSIDNVQ